jgi:hypothetical protein
MDRVIVKKSCCNVVNESISHFQSAPMRTQCLRHCPHHVTPLHLIHAPWFPTPSILATIPSPYPFADLGAFHGGITCPFRSAGTHYFHIHGTLRQASHVHEPKSIRDTSMVAQRRSFFGEFSPAEAPTRRVMLAVSRRWTCMRTGQTCFVGERWGSECGREEWRNCMSVLMEACWSDSSFEVV